MKIVIGICKDCQGFVSIKRGFCSVCKSFSFTKYELSARKIEEEIVL